MPAPSEPSSSPSAATAPTERTATRPPDAAAGNEPSRDDATTYLPVRLDPICDQFEVDWLSGGRPLLEDFLPNAAEADRPALMRELLALDLEYRARRDETPTAEEYRRRLPGHAALIEEVFVGQKTRPDATPGPAPIVHVPGYEVLSELGRGGMGVVYQARHIALNRVVALKMILTGEHADPEERQRFRAEAEAVARLQHPNIVQIYEIGEHDGRPFFSLEFCAGGGLNRKLDGAPLPPVEAARLVETLARAIHAAHAQHIIHRDLKPANVLLSADGAPKVGDFGLAKRLDDGVSTRSGVIKGTPSYMAPEQAVGKSDEIGPATDVYGLGAILYELLTGRPPFRGPTPMDTLLQVASDEPVAPRKLQPRTPADVETVCLKCLEKSTGRRYATALELAEDLRRFREGEPVRARPVGRWERGWKWVRRRPAKAAAAGLLLAFAIAVAAGGALSTYFAVEANANFVDARRREKDARDALARRDETNRRLEETLAVSLLRSIGHQDKQVAGPEIDAFWDLASLPTEQERVRLLFVERSLQRRMTSQQLEWRADLAVHAAVGLDPERRRQVEKRLLARLRDPENEFDARTSCVLIGVALDDWSPEFASAAARQAMSAVEKTTDPNARGRLQYAVEVLATRLQPADASETAQQALQAMVEVNDFTPWERTIAALAPRLTQEDARKLSRQVMEALAKGAGDLGDLASVSAALAPRLTQEDARELAGRLVQALATTDSTDLRGRLWKAATALAPGLTWPRDIAPLAKADDEQAGPPRDPLDGTAGLPPAETVRLKLDEIKGADNSEDQDAAARAVAILAPRLTSSEAAEAIGRAVKAIQEPDKTQAPGALVKAVAALALRLGPADAARAGRQAVEAIKATRNFYSLSQFAEVIAALAPQMSREEAAEAASAAAGLFAEEMAGTGSSSLNASLAEAVAHLAPWMPAADAAHAAWTAARLAAATADTPDGWPNDVAQAEAVLIVQVRPEDAVQRTNALGRGVGNAALTGFLPALEPLAEAAAPLPGRFTEQQLVDLLKMPTCQWKARQVIVRQLGWQCGQSFANLWDFVEWARTNRRDLDLTSPPVRPVIP